MLSLREPSMPTIQLKNSYMSKFMLFLIQFLYPKANKIIAQSRYMKKDIENIFHLDSSKVVVMNNPLDKESIERLLYDNINPYTDYKDRYNFVYVGRLSDEKKILYFLWKFLKKS